MAATILFFLLALLSVGSFSARAKAQAHVGRLRSSLGVLGGLLGILGGVSLIVRFGGGLYLCALGTLLLTWIVVWNAFNMMLDTYTQS